MAKSLCLLQKVAILYCLLVKLEASIYENKIIKLRDSFEWIPYEEINENMHRLTPLNHQGTTPQYVCRWWHLNNWIPGKFYVENDEFRCRVGYARVEHVADDFEVLYTPEDSVEWERWDGILPDNAVSVGSDPGNRQETYIGRAMRSNMSIIGKVSGAKCYIPYGDKEYKHTVGFDVLVVTEVGKEISRPLYKVGI